MTASVGVLVLRALCLGSLTYLAFAIGRVAGLRRPGPRRSGFTPAVTLLKPVCGLEPRLLECLRSFCGLDYPVYQIVFGIRDAADPAIPVIRGLMREYPDRDFELVIDDRLHGPNLKASSLANMVAAAKHDILVVSDSDTRVEPSYLHAVVGPFEDPKVGATTCLYTGVPSPEGGLPSVLGAMFINDWFLPSVLVALALEDLRFCFGATMAVRREALAAIGGFPALASYLADDYMLGKLVSEKGYAVRLASCLVEDTVTESGWKPLFLHELRWARTVRTVQPVGHAFSFLTDTIPLALVLFLAAPASALALAILSAAILLRVSLHLVVRAKFRLAGPSRPWLVPVRDLLSCLVRLASFFGREVEWRERRFVVLPSGRLRPKGEMP